MWAAVEAGPQGAGEGGQDGLNRAPAGVQGEVEGGAGEVEQVGSGLRPLCSDLTLGDALSDELPSCA